MLGDFLHVSETGGSCVWLAIRKMRCTHSTHRLSTKHTAPNSEKKWVAVAVADCLSIANQGAQSTQPQPKQQAS